MLGAFGALFIVAIIYGILWKRKKDKVKQADASFDPALLAGDLNVSNFGTVCDMSNLFPYVRQQKIAPLKADFN